MNIEETKEAIKVMQAFVDGKAVEGRDRTLPGPWHVSKSPTWSWGSGEYRIEPVKVTINIYKYNNSEVLVPCIKGEGSDSFASTNSAFSLLKSVEVEL